MKKLLPLIALLVCVSVCSQKKIKLSFYEAPTGNTYKIGDVLWLGKPSGKDGKYQFIRVGGWAKKIRSKGIHLSFKNENRPFTIKKMYKYKDPRWKSVHVTLGSSDVTNYSMDLDNALAHGEIKETIEKKSAAQNPEFDKYDKLRKLKGLLDDGVLTQEEYDAEKKKLLDQ